MDVGKFIRNNFIKLYKMEIVLEEKEDAVMLIR